MVFSPLKAERYRDNETTKVHNRNHAGKERIRNPHLDTNATSLSIGLIASMLQRTHKLGWLAVHTSRRAIRLFAECTNTLSGPYQRPAALADPQQMSMSFSTISTS